MDDTINQSSQTLLDNFGKLLYYGNHKINTVRLEQSKVRLKKHVLYFMMCAVQSYSESIHKLISPSRIYDKAAEVLMRSLVETFINLNYIYACKTQKNALIFIVDSINERIDFARKYQSFMNKYPSWDIPFGTIKKADDWETFIKQKEKEISDGKMKFKVRLPKELPDLRARAIIFDNCLKSHKKLTRKKSLEYYYVAYYKYFSQIAHLTMPGLERFWREDNAGYHLDVDGKQADIDRVAAVTYQLYFVVLRFFLKQFRTYEKSEFTEFERYSKTIAK